MTIPEVVRLLSQQKDRELIEDTMSAGYAKGETFWKSFSEIMWVDADFADDEFRDIYDTAVDLWIVLCTREPRTSKWTDLDYVQLLAEAQFSVRGMAFELGRSSEALRSQLKRHGWRAGSDEDAERLMIISSLFFGWHDDGMEFRILKAERKGDTIITNLAAQRYEDGQYRRLELLKTLGMAKK